MRKVLTLSAVVGLLSNCAALQQLLAASFQPPTITFRHAQVSDMSLTGATVNLTYQVDNPNAVSLSLASVDYAFFVEGKQVVAGHPPQGLHIPASGSAEIVLPASVKFMDIAPVLETFLTKESAAYRAQGSLGVNTPLGIISLPLEKEGHFHVPKLPTVTAQPPRITQLGLTSATIEVILSVTNRNDFALPLGGVAGEIQLAGGSVATVNTGDLGMLVAKETRPVALPITVQFLQAGSAIVAAVRGGPTTFGFQGALRVSGISIPVALTQTVTLQR